MLRYEDLRVRDRQTLDRDFFNRRFRLIAESLGQIGEDVGALNTDTDRLVNLGLNRVNEVLGPLLGKVQAASENGFLVAPSITPLTITLDLETTLVVGEAYRDLFQPTPYVLLSRQTEGTHSDWAILFVQAYNRENGGLAFKVVQVNGDIGADEYSDWVVSATAGVSAAVMQTAADAQAAVELAEQAAQDAAAAAAAAEGILSSGPVASVNGQTGLVSLGISDIPNLTSTLGGKADSNHGHTIAQVSNLQTALDGKAASSHTHAIANVTGLQTALDGKAASSHGHIIGEITGLQTALDGKQAASANLTAFAAKSAPNGAVVGTSDTQTLTNKRVTPRVVTSSAPNPFVWNSDNSDRVAITGLASMLTMSADAGTPTDMQSMLFRVVDNGSIQTITWVTDQAKSFRAVGVTLPANTAAGKTLYIGCVYNSAASRWDVISINQQA